MKKILITGSNGLLGQKLVAALKNKMDVALIATSRGQNRISSKRNYLYESLDVTDASRTEKIIRKYRPATIINTAAMTNVNACEDEIEDCRKINVDAVATLVQASHKYGIHLIQISTDFIFDGTSGPYKEEDGPHPLNSYGRSKLDAEKLIQASSIRWTIIRTILVYGVAEQMNHSNFVLWVKNAMEKGQTIPVINDQFRAPTLAEDLADACTSAALKQVEGVYHASGKETMSILDAVKMVAEIFDLDPKLIQPTASKDLKEAATRPARTGFILDKAIRDLDYQPHSFRDGLNLVKEQLTHIKAGL